MIHDTAYGMSDAIHFAYSTAQIGMNAISVLCGHPGLTLFGAEDQMVVQ